MLVCVSRVSGLVVDMSVMDEGEEDDPSTVRSLSDKPVCILSLRDIVKVRGAGG